MLETEVIQFIPM